MKRFLIIQPAFLGDVVLALPVAQALHQAFPDADIHMVVRKGNEAVLANHPAVHRVFLWHKQDNKYKALWQLAMQLRQYRYEAVYNLHRFASSGWLTLMMRTRMRVGFDKNPLSRFYQRCVAHQIPSLQEAATLQEYQHETDRNVSLLPFPVADRRPRLYPTDADVEAVSIYQERGAYYVIAPASVWPTKQWPAEKWKQLLARIPNHCWVYLIGAPGDGKLAEKLVGHHPLAENLCGQLTPLQSAVLMQGALRNFVNDSAPLHFASGVNAPVTAVFNSTVPAFGFGPLSDDSRVAEVATPLSCRPCGLHGKRRCPRGHFHCANLIAPNTVMPAMEWFNAMQHTTPAGAHHAIVQGLWHGQSLVLQAGDTWWWVRNALYEQITATETDSDASLLVFTDQRMLNPYVRQMPEGYFQLLDLMYQRPLSMVLPYLQNLPAAVEKSLPAWIPAPDNLLRKWVTTLDRPLLITPVAAEAVHAADLYWKIDAPLWPEEIQRVSWQEGSAVSVRTDAAWAALQQWLGSHQAE